MTTSSDDTLAILDRGGPRSVPLTAEEEAHLRVHAEAWGEIDADDAAALFATIDAARAEAARETERADANLRAWDEAAAERDEAVGKFRLWASLGWPK